MNFVPIDMLPTQGPLLPTSWVGEIRLSLLHFGTFMKLELRTAELNWVLEYILS